MSSTNTNAIVKISNWRSLKRDPKTKETRFEVVYENGDKKIEGMSSIKNTPLIYDIVCDFIDKAIAYPYVKRMCLTCGKDADDIKLVFCDAKTKICSKMFVKYGPKILEKREQKCQEDSSDESDESDFEEENMEIKYKHTVLLKDRDFDDKTIVKETFKRFREECNVLNDGQKRLHDVIALYNNAFDDNEDLCVVFRKNSVIKEKVICQLNTIWRDLGGISARDNKDCWKEGRDVKNINDFKKWFETGL